MVRNWEDLLISLVIGFLALLLLMVVTLAAMLRQHRRFRRQMLLQAGEITHLSEDGTLFLTNGQLPRLVLE